MFAKFQLDISDYFYNSQINRPENIQTGNKISNCFGEESYRCMKGFICDNGKIDGTALKEHWFGIAAADIFISHSHKDLNKVKAFAGWLYRNFGLKAFIDSCTWGYVDDLLKLLDDQYCWNKNSETYNYTIRNYTTSHVHMMLATALTEMIDNTECLMFYKTPNSIKISEEIQNTKSGKRNETISPWIYHELSISSMMRQKNPIRTSALLEHRAEFAQNSLQIVYNVEKALQELIVINEKDLEVWKTTQHIPEHPLDTLYELNTKLAH